MRFKKGDLVVVTKPSPCCGNASAIGKVFTVQAVGWLVGVCNHCEYISTDAIALVSVSARGSVIFDRLKKLDAPSDELDVIREQELEHG